MEKFTSLLLVLCSCLVIAACAAPPSVKILSPPEQDQLVSAAKTKLDEWGGQGEMLDEAVGKLRQVLRDNPKHVQAHIEMARYYMKSGYINFRNFEPGALDRAEQEIRLALQADPNSANAYVLLGHVYHNRRRPQQAVEALQRAETIGTDNPWLDLNWADALMEMEQWKTAEERLCKAEARFANDKNPPRGAMISLYEKMVFVYEHQGSKEAADGAYRKAIAINPTAAWTHGNYADFLLFRLGNPDAAIEEASKALSLMNYGAARATLAAAQYAKWVQLKKQQPAKAAEYSKLMQQNAFGLSWIMPQAGKSVDAGPAIQDMVMALIERGVSIDARDEHGDTALTLAAYEGNLKAVNWLIQHGADVNVRENQGWTALSLAKYKRHVTIVETLLKHGAK